MLDIFVNRAIRKIPVIATVLTLVQLNDFHLTIKKMVSKGVLAEILVYLYAYISCIFYFTVAPPSIITNVIIDPQTVRVDRIVNDVSFTLNWNEPFTNFDPIVNYTITITCIIATKCPMIYIINGTSLDVNLITDLSVMNHNISITANNSIGESIATSRLIIGKLI